MLCPPIQSLSSMHGIPAHRNDKEIVIVLSALHTCTRTHILINTRRLFRAEAHSRFYAMKPNNKSPFTDFGPRE